MDILHIVIPVSLLLLTAGGLLFWWTVRHGQYDDLDSPAQRILFDDDEDMLPDDIKPPSSRPSGDDRTDDER
ncbi:MAG: cbb3-type cytochrome oxidase assembly protein CcoS [Saccharospirillum sp.]